MMNERLEAKNINELMLMTSHQSGVVVTDVDMHIGTMVMFIVKCTFASLIAVLFLGVIFGVITFIFALIMAALIVALF